MNNNKNTSPLFPNTSMNSSSLSFSRSDNSVGGLFNNTNSNNLKISSNPSSGNLFNNLTNPIG